MGFQAAGVDTTADGGFICPSVSEMLHIIIIIAHCRPFSASSIQFKSFVQRNVVRTTELPNTLTNHQRPCRASSYNPGVRTPALVPQIKQSGQFNEVKSPQFRPSPSPDSLGPNS